jgi:hypothetical protein
MSRHSSNIQLYGKSALMALLVLSLFACAGSPAVEDVEVHREAEAQSEQESAAGEDPTEKGSGETENDAQKEPGEDPQLQILSTGFLSPPDEESLRPEALLTDSTIASIAEPDASAHLRKEETAKRRLYWREGEQPQDDDFSSSAASEDSTQRPPHESETAGIAAFSPRYTENDTLARGEDRKADTFTEPTAGEASSRQAAPRAPAVPTPAAASSSAAAPAGGEKEKDGRVVRALPGDTVDLFLPGRGWVYDRSRSQADGLEFKQRFYEEEKTEFIFAVYREGFYRLSFSREDMRTGESEREVISLLCSTEEKPNYQGERESELWETGREARDAVPAGAKELAQAVAAKDISFLLSHYHYLLRAAGYENTGEQAPAFQAPAPPLIVDAAEVLLDARRERESLDLLLAAIRNGSQDARTLEEIYFLLGRLYESPGPIRDESTAIAYYRRVVDNFPAGIFWYRAKERISYLERHYLQVR